MKKEQWNSEAISDQHGRVAVVTGSNSGTGLETARVLAGKGARVIMAIRNLRKGEVALAKIKKEQAGGFEMMVQDRAKVRERWLSRMMCLHRRE